MSEIGKTFRVRVLSVKGRNTTFQFDKEFSTQAEQVLPANLTCISDLLSASEKGEVVTIRVVKGSVENVYLEDKSTLEKKLT